jgi:adhesin/invasin
MTGTVDRNYELSRLGYEGFPVDSTESLAISTGGQGGIDLTKLSNSGSRHYDLSTLAPPPAGTLRITDAAAFSTGPVAQGSLISLFGNFGVTQTSATSLPLPTSLSQLSVTVAGRLSPLLFVGASQVNLQLPFETPEGNAQVVVSVRGGAILSGTVAVTRTAPKLFSSDGKHAVVLNEDYTLNSSTNPAKAGSYLIAYITGQGALRTPVASGAAAPSSPPAVTAATTTAMIGGKPANVAFSGGAPGFAGVAQVNVQVPGGLANAVPLTVTVGGAESNALVIYIAP